MNEQTVSDERMCPRCMGHGKIRRETPYITPVLFSVSVFKCPHCNGTGFATRREADRLAEKGDKRC